MPPKPAEAKVQPKKETVRITLPPKPTASPTIRLPSVPPAGNAPAAAAPVAPAVPPPSRPMSAPPPPPPPPSAVAAAPAPAAAPAAPGALPGAQPGRTAGSALTTSRPTLPGQSAAAPAPAPVAKPAPVGSVGRPKAAIGVFDTILGVLALLSNLAACGVMYYLTTLFEQIQQ